MTPGWYQLVTHKQLSLTASRLTADGYVYPVGLNYYSHFHVRLAAAN